MFIMASRFDGLLEAQLLRTYASAKGWRTRKIKAIQYMIRSLNIKFNLSSFNRLQSKRNTELTDLTQVVDAQRNRQTGLPEKLTELSIREKHLLTDQTGNKKTCYQGKSGNYSKSDLATPLNRLTSSSHLWVSN